MNRTISIYYAIMNILDGYAIAGEPIPADTLTKLAKEDPGFTTLEEYISDIADANDCGKCSTWTDLQIALADLFRKGERI